MRLVIKIYTFLLLSFFFILYVLFLSTELCLWEIFCYSFLYSNLIFHPYYKINGHLLITTPCYDTKIISPDMYVNMSHYLITWIKRWNQLQKQCKSYSMGTMRKFKIQNFKGLKWKSDTKRQKHKLLYFLSIHYWSIIAFFLKYLFHTWRWSSICAIKKTNPYNKRSKY
jgi:hypothetical protein